MCFFSLSKNVLPYNRVLIKKSWLILVICNQFYSRCSGNCIDIVKCRTDSGEENVRQIRNLKHNYQLDVNSLENWLQFVLTQMTHTYHQLCDKCNTFMIITIKNITCRSSNKFQDTIFKNSSTF